MFYHSFTALTFTEGLKIYLSDAASNPLGDTDSRQLYDAWQRAVDNYNNGTVLGSGYKVAELFGNWEQQEGYPILYVERSYHDHRVRFTQVSELTQLMCVEVGRVCVRKGFLAELSGCWMMWIFGYLIRDEYTKTDYERELRKG